MVDVLCIFLFVFLVVGKADERFLRVLRTTASSTPLFDFAEPYSMAPKKEKPPTEKDKPSKKEKLSKEKDKPSNKEKPSRESTTSSGGGLLNKLSKRLKGKKKPSPKDQNRPPTEQETGGGRLPDKDK